MKQIKINQQQDARERLLFLDDYYNDDLTNNTPLSETMVIYPNKKCRNRNQNKIKEKENISNKLILPEVKNYKDELKTILKKLQSPQANRTQNIQKYFEKNLFEIGQEKKSLINMCIRKIDKTEGNQNQASWMRRPYKLQKRYGNIQSLKSEAITYLIKKNNYSANALNLKTLVLLQDQMTQRQQKSLLRQRSPNKQSIVKQQKGNYVNLGA